VKRQQWRGSVGEVAAVEVEVVKMEVVAVEGAAAKAAATAQGSDRYKKFDG